MSGIYKSDYIAELQKSAQELIQGIKNYYEAFQELEAMANELGYTIDTKTGEFKKQ